jgi:hypothetical protein
LALSVLGCADHILEGVDHLFRRPADSLQVEAFHELNAGLILVQRFLDEIAAR